MEGETRQQGRLPRIAATLLNLAALAERAALRSLPVRFLVLAILWHAEAIARKFVASEMESFDDIGSELDPYIEDLDASEPRWPSLDGILPPAGFTLDANLLALRLRMLASILIALSDAGLSDDEDSAGWLAGPIGDWPRHLLYAASAPSPLPLFLVIRYPAARYRALHPPDTS